MIECQIFCELMCRLPYSTCLMKSILNGRIWEIIAWPAVKLTLLHYLVLYWGMNGNLPSWYKGVRKSRCSLFTLIRLSEWVNTAHTVNFYPDRIIKKNRIVSYFHSREHSVDTVIP